MAHARTCSACGSRNLVGECTACARSFVLTNALPENRMRRFDEVGLKDVAESLVLVCDFDWAKASGQTAASTVEQGLRQKTCVACRTAII